MIDETYQLLVDQMRSMQLREGYWTGALSTSPLSTATAVSALAVCLHAKDSQAKNSQSNQVALELDSDFNSPDCWSSLIARGSEFLCKSQNNDGGFGDTDRSYSNIATTLLVIAAWRLAGKQELFKDRLREAQAYIERHGNWEGLRRRYGKDKTFVVPILSNCALAGMVAWKEVSPLPFEAAVLPQSWYRFAQMPVVSYAIPALVAIGQARYFHAPPRNPILWLLRRSALRRTRRVLRQMQPQSGGYLEATPLTSFVLMNLASMGLVDSDVSIACRKFIVDSVQADGSWPIDTNLATWVTSLAIPAFLPHSVSGESRLQIPSEVHSTSSPMDVDQPLKETSIVRFATMEWLLSCQHRIRHPFTGAEPGGWGWTNLSGAVPDADDTPAALLALHAWNRSQQMSEPSPAMVSAVTHGLQWLLKLQNRDGGWPTFCRGWGKLPFDRSGADLTAHAIRALSKCSQDSAFSRGRERIGKSNPKAIQYAIQRGLNYLRKHQHKNGSWLPLWFGNQDHPNDDNPIYGTARVLLAFGELPSDNACKGGLRQIDLECAWRGIRYLIAAQNSDGGWGGGASVRYPNQAMQTNAMQTRMVDEKAEEPPICSTIEETAVVIEGLVACRTVLKQPFVLQGASTILLNDCDRSIERATVWLTSTIKNGGCERSQPIGFYFAKLWYHERLYPYIFAAAALNRLRWSKVFESSVDC